MAVAEPWVGSWRPHRPRGPIAALYGSPGPKYALPGLTGASKHDATRYKAPMYSFGTRHDRDVSNSSPGPKYLIPSDIIRTGRHRAPAFVLQSRPKEQGSFKGPGPGQYSPELSQRLIFHSAPAYSLCGRGKDFHTAKTPGPASYTLPAVLGSKTVATHAAPAYSLRGRSKTGGFHEDMQKTPGPAAYKVVDPSVYREKPPRFSMTGRNFAPGENTKKPGPGTYYPEKVTTTRASAPRFSFGIRHSAYIAPLIVSAAE